MKWLKSKVKAKVKAGAVSRSVTYSTSPLLASKTPPWRSKFVVALVGLGSCVLVASADNLVAGERAVGDRQGRAGDIGDGTAGGVEADDPVVGQGDVGDGQVAAVVEDAAAQGDGA